MDDLDLFGQKIKLIKNINAYPALPGTANNRFKCRDCINISRVSRDSGATYFKCVVIKRWWTNSAGTDIKASSAACLFFERKLSD